VYVWVCVVTERKQSLGIRVRVAKAICGGLSHPLGTSKTPGNTLLRVMAVFCGYHAPLYGERRGQPIRKCSHPRNIFLEYFRANIE
jgi:hypothetical protein